MTQKQVLFNAYALLSSRFHGERFYTISHFFELFKPDLKKLREKSGPLHCTNLNSLLIEDLLASGLFSKDDIERHWTLLWWISPHQYLKVKTEDGWIKVDLWAKSFGIEFGDYAHDWHVGDFPIKN